MLLKSTVMGYIRLFLDTFCLFLTQNVFGCWWSCREGIGLSRLKNKVSSQATEKLLLEPKLISSL